jgi:ATP-dependent Clp protease adaptor protein ClpS
MFEQTVSDPQTTTKPRTTTGVDYITIPEDELEKPFRVMILNDEVTPMEFVVLVLRTIFALTYGRALRVMLEAHNTGCAHVVTLPLAEAQEKVYAAHTQARAAGYPLSFYLEPDD